jgi:glycosyltransferase involved in cell wall biosynthesis
VYLLPTQVPVYLEGPRPYVTTEWKRSLVLLRDSFGGRFGPLVLACPFRTVGVDPPPSQALEAADDVDDIEVRGLFPERVRARKFWLKQRGVWLAGIRELLDDADVVHAGLDDVYRPITYSAWSAAVERGRMTVFVQDTDIATQIVELNAKAPLGRRALARAYAEIYERLCRRGVSLSDLSLLKGAALMSRYGSYAKNAKSVQDTSHGLADVISEARLEQRIAEQRADRPLRFVYAGRLVPRKGVLRAVGLLGRARQLGARLELDLIGDGDEREAIVHLARELGVEGQVRLLGRMNYGPKLLQTLSTYDALYFTPLGEDTPRMIFDGFAAGLPLVGSETMYHRERLEQDQAVSLLSQTDDALAVDTLVKLDRDRAALGELSRKARLAGLEHAAESWYERRAAWTIEAHARHAGLS